MVDLATLFVDKIRSGLKRKSLVTCSKWAEACRIMGGDSFPGPWTFIHHPWLKEMHDTEAEMNIGQKAAQMGFTEWALNTAFFNIDIKNKDVLYVLPTLHPDASDFSSARFDIALELSDHLNKLFSDVRNVGHKRAGSNNLYIRGSRSRSQLKSIPTGTIILDEVNEMTQKNIPLALERASGQIDKQFFMLSTPTVPGIGINKYFNLSSKEQFFFKCPGCSKFTQLVFPDSIEIVGENELDPRIEESHLICKECKVILHHEEKRIFLSTGKWVPEHPSRIKTKRGFHISQLYSCAIKPKDIAHSFFLAKKNPADEQEFYNSKLGLPCIVGGANISDDDLDRCKNQQGLSYLNGKEKAIGLMTMGVDVGKYLHVNIDQWKLPGIRTTSDFSVEAEPKTLWFGKVLHFEELDKLMYDWRIISTVVDINPERRKAYEFACRFPGHVKLCIYGRGVSGKQVHSLKEKSTDPLDEYSVLVDRTSWIDLALGRFKTQRIRIPVDIDQEYRGHMKALVRTYERDKDGNPCGKYVKDENEPDHYAHARTYSEIALLFSLGLGNPQNIKV